MGVPAFLFYLQNILVFFALGYINAATFQLLSQLKILTTAIISILILKTKIDLRKWVSLILLVVGVWIIEVKLIYILKLSLYPVSYYLIFISLRNSVIKQVKRVQAQLDILL